MHTKQIQNIPVNLAEVRLFAERAHRAAMKVDASNEGADDKYFLHHLAVAGLVASAPGSTREMVAAALLDGILLETDVKIGEICQKFGPHVSEMVDWATDHCGAKGGKSRSIYIDRISRASEQVQTVKIASVISKVMSLARVDYAQATHYIEQELSLLSVLTLGESGLRKMASRLCEAGLEQLAEITQLNNEFSQQKSL